MGSVIVKNNESSESSYCNNEIECCYNKIKISDEIYRC